MKRLYLVALGACHNLVPTILEFCSSLSVTSIAAGLQATATNLAALAQIAWNTAVSLFPAVVVVAALAAVVAGVVLFIKHINQASQEQQMLNAETEALKKKNDELNESLAKSKETYKAIPKGVMLAA